MAKTKKLKERTPLPVTLKDRKEALKKAIDDVEKAFGSGAIMKLGDANRKDVPVISTGFPSLDIATGVGGIPKGRVIEIYGPESSGKTTLALHIISEAQRQKDFVAFVDAEHALDPSYAKSIGVDIDDMIVNQPSCGEEGLEVVDKMVNSGAIGLIVIDSVACLTPRAEIEGAMGDSHMGLQARLMSQALRKLMANIGQSKTSVVFINQLRMKIGVTWGNPEVTTGGNALKFYSSMRMDVRRIETLKVDDVPYGTRVRVKIVKNKVAPPFKKAEIINLFGNGFSKEESLIDASVLEGIIEQSGAWLKYKNKESFQGRSKLVTRFMEDSDFMNKIMKETYEKAGISVPAL